jgi:transposase
MGKPYSLDLRERIVGHVLAGHSARSAARVFGVSPSTAVRLASDHRRKGSVAPKPQGRRPGTVGKLAVHIGFLIEVIKSDPDITLRELSGALEDACGVQVRLSSIHRALVRTGYSYKKRAGGAGA